MDPIARLLLGSLASDHLLVEPKSYERPEAGNYSDANWLVSEIRIVADAFRGQYEATLITDEFAHFRKELGPLQETLNGEAVFEACET